MRTIATSILSFCLAGLFVTAARAQASVAGGTRVTIDTFRRAETDTYLARFVKEGAFEKWKHERDVASIDNQTVIRLNRDTLYSFAIFDLDAGPVTVTLPDPGQRFLSMQVIDQDHYAPYVFYAPGVHTLSKAEIGTRYVALAVRTFVNPKDAADVKAVHALQDAIRSEHAAGGSFEIPQWDQESLKQVREALLQLAAANGGIDSAKMFGHKDQVEPTAHLIGTAAGWGGNPKAAAIYVGVNPAHNDGKTPYVLRIGEVPVEGFWSISVYNKAGYFEKNAANSYTVNNVTAQRDGDGAVTVHFGGDAKATNFIPITPGWNYLIRLYRPRPEILDGRWKAPEAQVAK